MSQSLLSAAVVIGALRFKHLKYAYKIVTI